jgi:mono/diheme cytochrome c family protein/glucose/arabinose dehydrogenase
LIFVSVLPLAKADRGSSRAEENEFIQVAAPARPAAKPPAHQPGPATPAPANAPAAAPATPDPATAAEPKGPRRAGGGPENPEIKFKLPPPPVLTPQEALKTFKVAPGFRIEAVATEPMIEAPIALSWDDQGRLYVLEMRGYMHDVDGAGEDQPLCRVSRLEDTNGDGIMDKSTVFADKLVMARAVMALGDGALIAEPPKLTFYHDTNGDGVADKTEVVNEKFCTAGGQPEHMANSPTWMQDNWIWSSNHGNRYRFQQGKFITEPITGFGQWGRTQDDWGRQYFNYNSDFLRTDLVPPTFYTRNPRLSDKLAINFQVVKDQTVWPSHPTPGVNRGYSGSLRDDGTLKACTATCGATIYRGDLFPPEYRGNAFIPEPSVNLVKRIIVSESDAVLKGTNAAEGSEFLTSTDERFRPVNAYTGPDGALYIVDMARGVLQHKGFLTYYLVANIQDRKLEQPVNLGRIYRIVPEGAKPAAVKLPRETAKVVPMLAHANGWVRDTAQRVLVERGDAAVVPAVKKLTADGATPQARVQALWTLEGLNALTPEIITARLHDADEHVRAAAVRLADPKVLPELVKLANDPSTQVRMHLAFHLSGQTGPGVNETLVTLLQNDASPIFGDAVVSGLAGQELEFLEMLLKQPPAGDDKLAGSRIFQTLAMCVMQERRGARVAQLLTLVAAQPADSPRQLALLSGMAGKEGGKAGAKGSTSPTAVKLEALPTALAALQDATHPKAKSLVAKVEQQLAWPGKAGMAAPVKVQPLTPAQQVLFERGKNIYATICGACHQPTGAGMAGLAPPLLNSDWALGPVERPIRIVLQGLTGPIEIHGTKWQLEMPGLPTLTDEDIAGVLTYIRREWEHGASPVSPAEVAKARTATKERSKAWTAEELAQVIEPKAAKPK